MEKCALALCNLSTYRPARDELMKVDAIDALATISSTGSELARRICSVALCNLVNDVEQSKRALSPSLPPLCMPSGVQRRSVSVVVVHVAACRVTLHLACEIFVRLVRTHTRAAWRGEGRS